MFIKYQICICRNSDTFLGCICVIILLNFVQKTWETCTRRNFSSPASTYVSTTTGNEPCCICICVRQKKDKHLLNTARNIIKVQFNFVSSGDRFACQTHSFTLSRMQTWMQNCCSQQAKNFLKCIKIRAFHTSSKTSLPVFERCW